MGGSEKKRRRHISKLAVIDLIEELNTKFVRDVIILQLGNGMVMALAFLTSVYVARVLHSEAYGLYALALTLFTTLNLLGNLNVNQPVVTWLSEARARGDRDEILRTLTFFFGASLTLCTIVFIIGFFGSPLIAERFYDDPQVGSLTSLLFLSLFFIVVFGYSNDLLTGFRIMKGVSYLQVGNQLFRSLFIIMMVWLGFKATGAVVGNVAGSAATAVFSYILLRRYTASNDLIPAPREVLANLRRIEVRRYLSMSISVALAKNLAMLLQVIPILLLGKYSRMAEVGYFKIAFSYITIPLFLAGAVATNLSAKLPESKGLDRLDEVKRNFWKVSFLNFILSGCVILFFISVSPLMISLYGEEYSSSLGAIYVLGAYGIMMNLGVGLGPLLRTFDRMWFAVFLHGAVIVGFLPAGIYLVERYHSVGAAFYLILMTGVDMAVSFAYVHRFFATLPVKAGGEVI